MTMRFRQGGVSRRGFLYGSAAGAGLAVGGFAAPALAVAGRPAITHGVQSGDVGLGRAVLWSRADRPSRMIVELAATERFRNPRRLVGPAALAPSDFAVKLYLRGLPAGEETFYRVTFRSLEDLKATSEPAVGRFRSAPADNRDVSFVWSGDTCGQGWGIDESRGGMTLYETMRRHAPDFFLHSGDTIYADGPLQAEQAMPDGGVWKNLMVAEKAKVAETLAEFRGQYQYNLLDANLRRFNAEVPTLCQWDDHEVRNNWYPDEVLDADPRYTETSVALLSARANRAFHEYMPIHSRGDDPERVYRTVHYGPHLDIFFLDMRAYRAANGPNRQVAPGPETAFLGAGQVRWLKRELLASRATWKVIAADMPIGLIVYHDAKAPTFEGPANGNGPALGRELEIADLLRFVKLNGVANTLWLTADVHYTAAHRYDPSRARFQDFLPFWEFVSGPIHAGSFGPNALDDTFGPRVVFQKAPPAGQVNLPPSAGLQFFGRVRIDGGSGTLTVELRDRADAVLYSVDLLPEG